MTMKQYNLGVFSFPLKGRQGCAQSIMTIFLSPTLWILTLYMISTTFSSSGLFFGFFNTLSLLSGHLPLTKEITMKNRHNEICLWQMHCSVELQWSPQSTPQTSSLATSNKSVIAQDAVHEGHNVHSNQWCKTD